MKNYIYNFETTSKKNKTFYVKATSFQAAVSKFIKKYPKATVSSVWLSTRNEVPVIID